MFKNRSFMLGLGLGIIIGALLLQLMLLAQTGREPLPETIDPATQEQQDDSVVPDGQATTPADESSTPTEQEETDPAAEAPAEPEAAAPTEPTAEETEAPDSTTAPTSSEPETPDASTVTEPTEPSEPADTSMNTEQPSQAPAAPVEPESSAEVQPQQSDAVKYSMVALEIEQGMNLKAVSEALANAGAVKDAVAFQRQAAEAGITGKLQIGNYSFQVGDSYSKIIREISTPKAE